MRVERAAFIPVLVMLDSADEVAAMRRVLESYTKEFVNSAAGSCPQIMHEADTQCYDLAKSVLASLERMEGAR